MSDSLSGQPQPNLEEPNSMPSGGNPLGEGLAHAVDPEPPSQPAAIPPTLRRQNTSSSMRTLSMSELPPGFYKLRIHGNCPRCKHWHRTVTVRISLSPAIFQGVRCENCGKRWLGVGGNSSHASFASVQTLDEDEWQEPPGRSALRDALLLNVRALSAVGSPTLAVVEENASPSPLGPTQESRSFPESVPTNVHLPSEAPKTTDDGQKSAVREPPPPETKSYAVKPSQTAPAVTRKSKGSQDLGFRKKTKGRILHIKKKCKDIMKHVGNRLRLTNTVPKSNKADKGKGKAVEPQHMEMDCKDTGDQFKLGNTTPSSVPMNEPQDDGSIDISLAGKAKNAAESVSSSSAAKGEDPSNSHAKHSLPSKEERQSRRDEEIRLLRKKLTEQSACFCGPICGSECRCRHHGRPSNSFPRSSQDDSSIYYSTQYSDLEPPVSQLPPARPSVRNSADFILMGSHLNDSHNGSMYAPSVNISLDGVSSRWSIGAITTVSSNFSTARTLVEGERSMTATSPPVGLLGPRPQSLPRQRSRSPLASASSPMSSLRIQTFPREDDNDGSFSEGSNNAHPALVGLEEHRTPTQRDYIQDRLDATGNGSENVERGRSLPANRGDNQHNADAHIATHDYARMVNGDSMRRLSEPTSISS